MKQARFGYVKLAIAIAVVTLALVSSIHSSKARVAPAPAADLNNEARVIGTYFDDLVQYDRQITEAGKKARLVSADLEPLERRSTDLKRRVTDIQNAVQEIVRKLKASGEWDNLDELIQARADARLATQFRQNSFKQILEESSTQLTSGANELGVPIDRLRSKLSRTNSSEPQFLSASYSPAGPMWKLSWGCRVTQLHQGVQIFVRGHQTSKLHEQYECACTNTNCFAW